MERVAAESTPDTLVVGCGFVGSHVTEALLAAGRPVRVLTRSRRSLPFEQLLGPDRLLLGDAARPEVLSPALEGVQEVVYCAGGLPPAAAERAPHEDEAMTLRPLRALLAALVRRPGVRLTLISSGGTVYGNPHENPVPEDHAPAPLGAYGAIRLAAEQLALHAHARGGLRIRILRCANVYGERQPVDRGQGAVAVFLDRIARRQEVVLYGRGEATRDFVYARDVGSVVCALLDHEAGPTILNVGSGSGISICQLLALTEQVLGRRARVVHLPARPFDVRQVVLDIRRLRALTGFEPTPLVAGLTRTAEAMGAHDVVLTA
jgi:UDP-glucose 4-epimerase